MYSIITANMDECKRCAVVEAKKEQQEERKEGKEKISTQRNGKWEDCPTNDAFCTLLGPTKNK